MLKIALIIALVFVGFWGIHYMKHRNRIAAEKLASQTQLARTHGEGFIRVIEEYDGATEEMIFDGNVVVTYFGAGGGGREADVPGAIKNSDPGGSSSAN